MNVVLSLLIVAIQPDAPTDGRYPGAAELFRCTFSESADTDFDGWPDRWTRQRGQGFPHFVRIFIAPDPTPAGDRCLRIEMDGGAAAAYTPQKPPVEVDSGHDYVVEGLVHTEGLQQDRAYLSLIFMDQRGRAVETFATEKIGRSAGWRKVRLGPVSPSSDLVRQAVIGVHVEPGSRADLQAVAKFGDLWLGRLPRVSLSTGSGLGLFTDSQPVKVACAVCGMTRPGASVHFELLDASGSSIAAAEVPLHTPGEPIHVPQSPRVATRGLAPGIVPPDPAIAQWQPPLPGVGFYRVRAAASGDQGPAFRREITLAVLHPQRAPTDGEFGWSVPRGGCPLPASALEELIAQSGVRWIKCPIPVGQVAKDARTNESTPSQAYGLQPAGFFAAETLDRLSRLGIEVVGVLEGPPGEPEADRSEGLRPSVAEWLSRDRKVWAPALETLAARSRGQVGWWQLGRDGDNSFVGYRGLAAKLDEIKAEFRQAGLLANLGVGWGWMDPMPEPSARKPAALRFLSLSADPPLCPRELRSYLAASPQIGEGLTTPPISVPRWVTLQALPKDQYAAQDRVADLAEQMIVAKAEGAAVIFLADPLDSRHGLLDDERRPGDLFLPWRTTALLLSGAKPAGRVTLPQGSSNQVFLRGPDAVMAVWNPRATRETVRLGPGVRRVDLWGRETPLSATDLRLVPDGGPSGGQSVDVGPLPAFLVGIDPRVVQWQSNLALAKDRIPGTLGQRLSHELTWKNTLDLDVEGSLTLVGPKGWMIEPRQIGFRLAGGELFRRVLDLVLPLDAPSGSHLVRADFEIRSDRPCRFSAWLPIWVGPDDVRIAINMQWNARGELEIQQRLLNDTDQAVRFRCQLLAPDRRGRATLAVSPARGLDLQVYRFADAKDLVGKSLWLRAEETDGPRVLNYRFVVGE